MQLVEISYTPFPGPDFGLCLSIYIAVMVSSYASGGGGFLIGWK